MQKLICILFVCCLVACSSETNYAPVTDITTIERIPKNGIYRVSPGETLYSIAWRYGLDYRDLAAINHINPPFYVTVGQRIYLTKTSLTPAKNLSGKPFSPPIVHYPSKTYRPIAIEHDANAHVSEWQWPARGPIVQMYSALNKGLNIGGYKGNPIYATAAGLVVYSGNGLRGYGNLIIIKHNSTYLSAYAHNSVSLVKEGQRVKAGQEIAEMGKTGARQTMLHFEIRRDGKPQDPLNYLKSYY